MRFSSPERLLELFNKNPAREFHMVLLTQAFFENMTRSDCEYGGWGLDCKRPFGNSFVEGDIADIIGVSLPDYDSSPLEYEAMISYLGSLYDDLGEFLYLKWHQKI